MALLRGSEVYVQPRTKRRLRWIARAMSRDGVAVSPDEVGDKLLNEIIEQKFPTLISGVEAEISQLEDHLVERLKGHGG